MIDLARLAEMPFARHLGMTFEAAEAGRSLVALHVQPFHLNLQGYAHGGVIPALVDAAGAIAIWSEAEDRAVLSADVRVSFIAPIPAATRVQAAGRVTHVSGNSAYASVEVLDEAGTMFALGQVTGIFKGQR